MVVDGEVWPWTGPGLAVVSARGIQSTSHTWRRLQFGWDKDGKGSWKPIKATASIKAFVIVSSSKQLLPRCIKHSLTIQPIGEMHNFFVAAH